MLAFFTVWVSNTVWHGVKPLPDGTVFSGPIRPLVNARFLADLTFIDANGERQVDQQIFDRIFGHVSRARRLIVMDMFLFNDFAGTAAAIDDDMSPLSTELTKRLIEQKRRHPELRVIFITDPLNTLYGSFETRQIERLRNAGIEVVMTELDRLRDSNPLWSGFWRLCCNWLGSDPGSGWLPNPIGETPVTLRGLLALPNFKANHRKTLVADTPTGWVGLVTSGNPHDASSVHSNIGIEFHGTAALDLLRTELAVVGFSAPALDWPSVPAPSPDLRAGAAGIQILTEAGIRDAVLDALLLAGPGDRVDLGMFYLSHRGVIRGLVAAQARGAQVRVLLDQNLDAFGRRKNGIPNQPVAEELLAAEIELRWCETRGEQCHDKGLLLRRADGSGQLIAGSANFTRRNLDHFNLETNARIVAPTNDPIMQAAANWFDRRWANTGGLFSLDHEVHSDDGIGKRVLYRLMEASGVSTF